MAYFKSVEIQSSVEDLSVSSDIEYVNPKNLLKMYLFPAYICGRTLYMIGSGCKKEDDCLRNKILANHPLCALIVS